MHRTYYHICNQRRRERKKLYETRVEIGNYYWSSIPRVKLLKDKERKKLKRFIVRRLCPCNLDTRGCFLWPKPRIHKLLLNARLCRLTETARLLKNVKNVFTRRSNAASRVNVEVELSRKLSFPQTLT